VTWLYGANPIEVCLTPNEVLVGVTQWREPGSYEWHDCGDDDGGIEYPAEFVDDLAAQRAQAAAAFKHYVRDWIDADRVDGGPAAEYRLAWLDTSGKIVATAPILPDEPAAD